MGLSNDMAALIGFALESLFYGVYCVLFLASSIILLWPGRRRNRTFNIPMVVANFTLFFCCTAHFALEFNHFYTTLEATGVPDFANETKKLVGADLLISFTDMLGEMVLVYRCYYVWGKRPYIVILPLLTAVAGFVCGAETLSLLASVDPSAPVAPASLVPLGTATYVLPLCTNVMVTTLIVGRIWYKAYGISEVLPPSSSGDSVQRAMIIVTESGTLYLVTQLIFVVMFAIRHPAQAIMGVVAVQIYGIAPTLIIIGVELGLSSDGIRTTGRITDFVLTTPFSHRQNFANSSISAVDTELSYRDTVKSGQV